MVECVQVVDHVVKCSNVQLCSSGHFFDHVVIRSNGFGFFYKSVVPPSEL